MGCVSCQYMEENNLPWEGVYQWRPCIPICKFLLSEKSTAVPEMTVKHKLYLHVYKHSARAPKMGL